jgi:hypothetical protein
MDMVAVGGRSKINMFIKKTHDVVDAFYLRVYKKSMVHLSTLEITR